MEQRDYKTSDGGEFWFQGELPQAKIEYQRFRGCIAQLLDDETMVGDVEGRWVVFKDGWVYGMGTYSEKRDAIIFGRQMLRDEIGATFIVVKVDMEAHAITAMHILGSAVSDADGFDLSTTPDEINRKPQDDAV
jgi:hypothetical protein